MIVLSAVYRWFGRPRRAIAAAFIVPLLFRTVPQLLAGTSFPIGYDTVAGYAPFARLVQEHGLGAEAFLLLQGHSAPLLWILIGSIASTGVFPYTLAEILPPLLYGGLGLAICRFARLGLGWTPQAALGAVLLTTSYFLPLRYGWDNLKDVAGLAFLFMALAETSNPTSVRRWVLFASFAAASVLTEEVEAVLLGGIAAVLFSRALRQHRVSRVWLFTGASCFALVLFYAGLVGPRGAVWFPPYGIPAPSSSEPPFLQGIVDYASWISKARAAALLITLGLAPLAYPAWKGSVRSAITDAWLIVVSIGTFGIFFIPNGVFPVWPTWLVLLSFPFGISATRGLAGMNFRPAIAIILALSVLSTSFVILPAEHALPYFSSPETRWYVPTSMIQTTVPLDRVAGVEAGVAWLNAHVSGEDWIVVSDVFAGFVVVFGNASHLYPYRLVETVNWSLFTRTHMLYTMYWADPSETWFAGNTPPKPFQQVFASGGVAVLAAEPSRLVIA